MNRRDFVKLSAAASVGTSSFAAEEPQVQGPNLKLRIAPVSLDIGPGKTIKTVGYNGSVPGPILRFREGKPVTVDVYNDTDVPEVVHWHGQAISPRVDGSVEEGTLAVPAHGHRQYRFTPEPGRHALVPHAHHGACRPDAGRLFRPVRFRDHRACPP